MIPADLPPSVWTPPKPAIIRPAEHALLKPGAFRPCSREERRVIIADLVRTKRLTKDEAHRAMFFVPVVGWVPTSVYVLQSPVAVNTSFTYTAAGGALEAHLYDGNDATPAACPTGFQTSTHIAYDFGSPVTIRRLRSMTYAADASKTWDSNAALNIQYSDTSLTTGFSTVSGVKTQHLIPPDSVGNPREDISDIADNGAHRYWRVYYASGSTSINAWLGEFGFYILS